MPIRMHVPLAPGTTTLDLGGQMMGASPLIAEPEAVGRLLPTMANALKKAHPTSATDDLKMLGEAAAAKGTQNLVDYGLPTTPTAPASPTPDLHQVMLQRRLHAMHELAPNPYTRMAHPATPYTREDGSQKGNGFLGVLPSDGSVMSEYSIADSPLIKGDYPSIVPTLNASELNQILNKHVPASAGDKALQFALARQKAGQPVFAQDGEQHTDILPMFQRIP